MAKPFKPMLSATLVDIDTIQFPVLVSPKLDGIRCIIFDGVAYSRNLKPIPNTWVQSCLSCLPDGMDGELIVGEPNASDVWNKTNSGVMSADGQPDFKFYVFDRYAADSPTEPFTYRLSCARVACSDFNEHTVIVPQHQIRDLAGLETTEQYYVDQGYEGVMLRDPNGVYKFGRSTLRERGLSKLKRWFDVEAKVIGFVERMHNGNEATTDALGRTKRSTHKANKTGRGDLGALVCDLNGVKFELGTGFTDEQRRHIWNNQGDFLGHKVTFKYQQLTPDGVPRFPVFMRFRYADTKEVV